MVESFRRQDFDLSQAEVIVHALEIGEDDGRVPHGIFVILVDRGIQRSEIHVFDFFIFIRLPIQLCGIGPSAKESIPGIQTLLNI